MHAKSRFVLFFAFFPLVSHAAVPGVSTTIEPIVGYERVQKFIPTSHSRDRLVYGARVTVGVPFLSAEGEYTRATDSETFASTLTTITETDDRVRLGARLNWNMLSLVTFFIRGGVQARQSRHDTTVASVTTTSTDPIQYNPYLGGGLRAHLGSQFALTADVTTVFRNFPNFDRLGY
jgi:hypothetical protein